jgi:hypothetical protein
VLGGYALGEFAGRFSTLRGERALWCAAVGRYLRDLSSPEPEVRGEALGTFGGDPDGLRAMAAAAGLDPVKVIRQARHRAGRPPRRAKR